MDKKVLKLINEQIKFEMESAYIYLAMSAWLNDEKFPGMSHFMIKQAGEEMDHARRLYDYVLEMGEKVEFFPISAPKADYEDVLDVFKSAYQHEQFVTKKIVDIMDVAQEVKCYATIPVMDWFIKEQVEEENTFEDLVTMLERINGNYQGLYILDAKLAQRQ